MQPGNRHNMSDSADAQRRLLCIGEVRRVAQQQGFCKGCRILREAGFHSFFGQGTQTLGKETQTVLLPCLYGDSSFCAELGEDAPAKRNGVLLRAAGQGHPNAEVSAEYVAGLGRLSVSQIGLHAVAFAADLHFCPDALAIQPRHAVGLGRQYDRQGLFIQGKQWLIIGPL